MKRLLTFLILMAGLLHMPAPTFNNKFTTNSNPESVPWTNTSTGITITTPPSGTNQAIRLFELQRTNAVLQAQITANTNALPANVVTQFMTVPVTLRSNLYVGESVGIGTTNPVSEIELANGTSEQAITFTRPNSSSYGIVYYKTAGVYDWSVGERSGGSDMELFNVNTMSALRLRPLGNHFLFSKDATDYSTLVLVDLGTGLPGINIDNQNGTWEMSLFMNQHSNNTWGNNMVMEFNSRGGFGIDGADGSRNLPGFVIDMAYKTNGAYRHWAHSYLNADNQDYTIFAPHFGGDYTVGQTNVTIGHIGMKHWATGGVTIGGNSETETNPGPDNLVVKSNVIAQTVQISDWKLYETPNSLNFSNTLYGLCQLQLRTNSTASQANLLIGAGSLYARIAGFDENSYMDMRYNGGESYRFGTPGQPYVFYIGAIPQYLIVAGITTTYGDATFVNNVATSNIVSGKLTLTNLTGTTAVAMLGVTSTGSVVTNAVPSGGGSGTATNAFNVFNISTNWTLGGNYTNSSAGGFSSQRAEICANIAFVSGAIGDSAIVRFELIRSGATNASIQIGTVAGVFTGATFRFPFSKIIQPDDIFRFINASTGSGTAVMQSGTYSGL